MRELFIVDVFTERRYAGNQLAVVVAAEPPTSEEMQAIAPRMNNSETTFVAPEPEEENTFGVRIFTPSEELPFAGHPVLGTAAVLREQIMAEPPAALTLATGIGRVPVRFADDPLADIRVWMRPGTPTLGALIERSVAAELLGLDLDALHEAHAPQRASIGIGMVLVPLASAAAVDAATFDLDLWRRLKAEGLDATGVFLFAEEATAAENDISARMFFDAGGAREDPATGSANTCLAAWLASTRDIPADGLEFRIEQGVRMGRPSVIHLRLCSPADEGGEAEPRVEIEVGGGVILTARGELV